MFPKIARKNEHKENKVCCLMSSGVPSSYTLGQYKVPTFIAIVSAHAATCNILGGKTEPPAFIFIFVKT